jgi:uncharacterized Fe-S cluster protein YjdI
MTDSTPPDARDAADDLTREYPANEITVSWHASRCIHSGNCVRALPRVFNPRRRPWIETDQAAADDIAAAVQRCPSGALQFVLHRDTAG